MNSPSRLPVGENGFVEVADAPGAMDMLSPLEAIRLFKRAKEPLQAISTGLDTWDRNSRGLGGGKGLAPTWYVAIGGDTGHGKSILGLHLARMAIEHGVRAGIVSLELSVEEIQTRFLAMMTGTPVYRLEPGPGFDQAAADEVVHWLDEFRAARGFHPLLVNRDPESELAHVLATMDAWRLDHGCRLFVVDYLQLCSDMSAKGMFEQTLAISGALKLYALRNRVVVVGLSQYNNESGNDTSRKPHAGSFYGGRRIAQDARQAVALDHSRYARTPDQRHGRTYLVSAKNGHGPPFEIPIEFDYQTLRIREAHADEEHLWPVVKTLGRSA